jgi:general secretion pathway protein K
MSASAAQIRATQPATNRDGFIVVAVLWLLGALALLASIYGTYVISTAAGFGPHEDRYRGEALASAALELTAYQLIPLAVPHPTHGQFSFRMAHANVAVKFYSEAARIDLNAAPKELLAGLFHVLGAEPDQAQRYADRIVSWRTTPTPGQDDKEAFAYHTAGLNYVPRGARFPHAGELSLILGLSPALVERALPFVTVYSGRAQINIVDAAPEVIAALPGLTPERLNAVLAARRGTAGDGQAILALLGPAQGHATTEASPASRVNIDISFDNGRRMKFEVVILLFAEGPEPYSVVSWREIDAAENAVRTTVR